MIRNPAGKSGFTTAAQRELAADSVVSAGKNFTDVPGGASGVTDRTNHLDDKFPAGGNILFLDGHVKWRPFDQMRIRTTGHPSFWW